MIVVATSVLVYVCAAAPSQSYAKKSKSQSAHYKAGFHEGAVRAHNDFETKGSVDGDNPPPSPNSNIAFCDGWRQGYRQELMDIL